MKGETSGPPIELGELAALASGIAKEAGRMLLDAACDRSAHDLLVEQAVRKSSATDLATAADRASEQLIAERLAKARPDDGLLGEEGARRPSRSGLTWIVDPLDGTTNFVYGLFAWSVSIALADASGTVQVGVVHDPLHGETFESTRGGGARRNGERLVLGPPPPLGEALVGTGFGYTTERRRAQAAVLPEVLPAVRDLRRGGGSAALDLCAVAAGRLDAFFEAGLRPWDRAAGLLIANEAGAQSREADGIVDGVATLVVAKPPLCEQLLSLLQRAAEAVRRSPPGERIDPPS